MTPAFHRTQINALLLCILTMAAMTVLSACRAPAPTVDPFSPYGTQRVPPPVTGSIGTPAPQAAPYYQGSATTTVAPQIQGGWRPPAATLNSQPLVQTQPTFNSPTTQPVIQPRTQQFANTTPNTTVPNTTVPGTSFTANGNTSLAPPTVTNPAVIGSQPTTVASPPASTVFGSGTRSAQTQPTGTPQLLNTNAAPPAQPGLQPIQPSTPQSNWGQPNANWSVPSINSGSQIQTTPQIQSNPGTVQLNGMHANNAVYPYNNGYAQPASAWSMNGVANWFRNTFGQPGQGYTVPQQYGQPVVYQAQAQGTTGYSTTAPQPSPLPVRGVQQNVQPAAYPAPAGTTQGAPVAPAAMQWGAVPMATNNNVTVRGNDDPDDEAGQPTNEGFVPSKQFSPTPHEAGLHAYHDDYLWIRGQLEYSAIERRWKLRYIPVDAPEGRMDSFGGSVVLNNADILQQFKHGDFVMVKGNLASDAAAANGFAPLYNVQDVTGM